MGQFVVSPTTQKTQCGRYRASFAVQRAKGNGCYCRVFRFDQTFSSSEAAQRFAIQQGWLETCGIAIPTAS